MNRSTSLHLPAHQRQRLRPVRFGEPVEEQVLALSVQQTGRSSASASGRASAISIEFVRLTMSGAGSAGDPVDQLVELLAEGPTSLRASRSSGRRGAAGRSRPIDRRTR